MVIQYVGTEASQVLRLLYQRKPEIGLIVFILFTCKVYYNISIQFCTKNAQCFQHLQTCTILRTCEKTPVLIQIWTQEKNRATLLVGLDGTLRSCVVQIAKKIIK